MLILIWYNVGNTNLVSEQKTMILFVVLEFKGQNVIANQDDDLNSILILDYSWIVITINLIVLRQYEFFLIIFDNFLI